MRTGSEADIHRTSWFNGGAPLAKAGGAIDGFAKRQPSLRRRQLSRLASHFQRKPRRMKSLILDETLDVSSQLRPRLSGRGCKVQSVCSLQELELTASLQEPPKLVIVNLTGELTAWQVSRYFQARPVTRAGLILVDHDPVPGLDTLAALPGIDCVDREDTARIDK